MDALRKSLELARKPVASERQPAKPWMRAAGESERDPTLYRIVSDRLRDKGRLRVWGCGPAGRHELVRLDRDRNDANVAFDEVERGDLVQVDGPRLTRCQPRSRRGT